MRDRNRVLLRVDNWEDLLTMGDPLAERPAFATAENSLQMYITVKALRKALKDSLYSISQNRAKLDKTPELVAQTDALVAQREKEHVFVSLHPQTEWTIASADEVDGEDAMADEDDHPEEWEG